jgi:hypothetical protein
MLERTQFGLPRAYNGDNIHQVWGDLEWQNKTRQGNKAMR